MDPRSLAHRTSEIPLGDQYYSWFRIFCTSNLARENYLLQLALLGHTIDASAVPFYLSPQGYETLKNQTGNVDFHLGDIAQFLNDAPHGSFNKMHLSNICDWLDQQYFERAMRLVVLKSAPGGRMVWRFLHVDRVLPDDLMEAISEEREFGHQLRLKDRYPFYSIVPAQING
jgi:S-adenosylmethionine:diacylglycerol 3-amino-3-carboxypropyl transferase